MLVDDSVSVRKFVGQMLEKAGFRVVTAIDGQDALQQLVELTVDVVVTDLEMPRLNGYALIKDLRRRPATREMPVIVMTSRAGEKHAALGRNGCEFIGRASGPPCARQPAEAETDRGLLRSRQRGD
jgi:chemosensory pili system protein ChpA (sensor histidine kinase/response regulator)